MNVPRYAPALVLAGGLLMTPTAQAQDADDMPADTVEVRSNNVVIKTPDGQKIYVHTDGDDARVYVGSRGDDFGAHRWRGDAPEVFFRHFDADHPRVFAFGDDSDAFTFDFDLPEIEPLLEGLPKMRVEWGESMKERAEIGRLDAETRRLAREIRRSEGAERERLEGALREQLETIFDRKLELRNENIRSLEERLEEEREHMATRRQSRDDIIERRLRELLGEDELDW